MVRWIEPSGVRWLGVVEPEDHPPTKTLADVVPEVRGDFEVLISHANSLSMQPKVRSAGRTCAEQQEQVALGYSHADLCRSMHVLGHAVDLDLSPNTCDTYTKLGEWWEGRGGVWGGRFPGFGPCGDSGHFQKGFGGGGAVPASVCPSGVTLAECRKIRKDYLDAAFAKRGLSGAYLAAGLVIAGALAAAWWLT